MTRVALTDGGGWFDLDKALEFQEDSRWNGSNHISVATGSQWDHEVLYYTASGNWVLHKWSQYQSVAPTYDRIEEPEAIQWLIANDEFEKLPEEVRSRMADSLDATEV